MMKRFKEDFHKYFWFIGGFALGYAFISLGHAAVQKRVTPPVSEIAGQKAKAPEFDGDFAALNQLEGKYAESWDQQQKLRAATYKNARTQRKVRN